MTAALLLFIKMLFDHSYLSEYVTVFMGAENGAPRF